MASKKYQVFVSSTFRDLLNERQDAIRSILDLNHIPAGMELFPATDMQQLEYIKKVIDECDYYVLIVGGRYGSMDSEGVSYTEREYDYAVQSGKVILAFVHDDPALIPVGKSDVTSEVVKSLNAFREKVKTGRLVKGWTTQQNLEPLVIKALMHAFNTMPMTGWIRGDAAASEHLLEQANNALEENARLKTQIANLTKKEPAQIEDIADFNDKFVIRYESSRYIRGVGTTYDDRTGTLTWREIFMAVASQLEKSKTDRAIFTAFQLAAGEANFPHSPVRMNETDRVRIKMQLKALGLITTHVSKTTQGGVEEFLSLTDRGQRVFLEGIVVRKSS